MKKLILSITLAMLFAPVALYSQSFYLGDSSGGSGSGNLYQIDASTCAISTIGAMGRSVTGLAVDASGSLFATESTGFGASNLLSINTSTGAATVIGLLTDPIEAVDHGSVPDITFRGGTLYGWSEDGDTVVTIDTATGEVTDLGNGNGSAGSGFAATPDGSMFVIPCGGCGFDLGNVDDSDLYSVNPATGVVTQVADLIDNTVGGNVESANVTIAAMTSDSQGNLWAYAGAFSGGGVPATSELITVNRTTGELLTVCTGLPNDIDALAFTGNALGAPLAIPSLNGWYIAALIMLLTGLVGMFGYRHFA